MTSDTTQTKTQIKTPTRTQTKTVTARPGTGTEELRSLITCARVVLWDFDGPICRLFAGHTAERVAAELVRWLRSRRLHGLLTDSERESPDPHAVLRAVDRRCPDSDLVVELEARLTQEELRAAASARPTPHADPLIRTWAALGARLAVTTNNSPLAARAYLDRRDLTSCFTPHVYGRTRNLRHLKPDPHCLNRALNATGATPARALMIGDTPTDHQAARRAGVPFLGYARNARKEKLLREAGATVIVGSLEPVLRILSARQRPAEQAGNVR